jgi:hypothetical protein
MVHFGSIADDFGLATYINTKLDLPTQRSSLINFFDGMRKIHPGMTEMERRESGELAFEEDRDQGSYRWVTVEPRRLAAGFMNPSDIESADKMALSALELAPYHLDISPIDCEALDVMMSFDFVYSGNHDEVVAEALGTQTTLDGFLQHPGAKVLSYEPSVMIALDDACRLQARLSIETRSNPFQVRTGQFGEAPLSVYFTVRNYWAKSGGRDFQEAFREQRKTAVEMVESYVIPAVVKPLAQTIATRQ